MNDGYEFCDPEWLVNGETELQFLDPICEVEEDGVLSKAQIFCANRFRDLDPPIVQQAIMNTFEVTLRDKAALRADTELVIDLLADGVRYVKERYQTYSTRLSTVLVQQSSAQTNLTSSP